MAQTLGRDTKINLGVAVAIAISLFGGYKSLQAEIRAEVETRVEKQVYEAEKRINEQRMDYIKEEVQWKLNSMSKDIEFIRHMLENKKEG